MQQFYSVIQYNAITLSDSKEHYSYKLQFINSARWKDINHCNFQASAVFQMQ